MKKITDLVKEGKLKEITDFRDEIDINGFKLTIDLRKGTDPDKLMKKLYKITPLEDSFKCNFNVLIDSEPKQLGLVGILHEWIAFRLKCARRELSYELAQNNEKLHLLYGLAKIYFDIDKVIKIIRNTTKDADVIPNLMEGFDIDKKQAEYIAEIKLRHINQEYFAKRLEDVKMLEAEIAEIENLLGDELKLKAWISRQLTEIKKKYGQPRRSYLEGQCNSALQNGQYSS